MRRVFTGFLFALIFTRHFCKACFDLSHVESFWLSFIFIRNKSMNGEIVKEATDVFLLESHLYPLA